MSPEFTCGRTVSPRPSNRETGKRFALVTNSRKRSFCSFRAMYLPCTIDHTHRWIQLHGMQSLPRAVRAVILGSPVTPISTCTPALSATTTVERTENIAALDDRLCAHKRTSQVGTRGRGVVRR